ncbi:MAG: hypothetical protein CXT77_03115 [uncultured DHVE6 group euryarchaeote]|jgi:hypothetical protein|nr:MAG: hypothetical protein CXT77_03115 [uncultured DHVE6 group euryarchaeote]
MKLLDKINPLKKKKEDFPHFDEKFGKPSGTAVPGPSADVDHLTSPGGDSSGFTQLPSAAPAPSNEKLDSIQRSVEMMNSTLEQLKRNMDSMSQRMSAIENKSNPVQPAPPLPAPQSPPVNAFNPQPQPTQPQPTLQPSFGQPPQQEAQQKKPPQKEEEEDSGWHF